MVLPVLLLAGHGQDDGTLLSSAGVQDKGQCGEDLQFIALLVLEEPQLQSFYSLWHFSHPLHNILWSFLMLGAEQEYRCLSW